VQTNQLKTIFAVRRHWLEPEDNAPVRVRHPVLDSILLSEPHKRSCTINRRRSAGGERCRSYCLGADPAVPTDKMNAKRTNFHESFAGSEIKPPSKRSTRLLFAAVALIVAGLCPKPHSGMGGARHGCDTSRGESDRAGSPEAPDLPLIVHIRASGVMSA
jgi:hypothetical protein